MQNKDGEMLLKGSQSLKIRVDDHLIKCILGPGYLSNPRYETKKKELADGLLEEYSCFFYIPGA